MRYLVFLLLILIFGNYNSFSQSKDTLAGQLTIDIELRPRAEYRDNFTWTKADSLMPKLYVTQRNRMIINYQNSKLRLHASPQEIHVWGGSGYFSRTGSINFFELYAEQKINRNLSVKIGRQALSLDNGRIFSAAPWSQQSRAHEGIRLTYRKNWETDLTMAFTRSYDKHFDPAYSPVRSHNYKFLFVHHLKYKFSNGIALTTINVMDVFKNTADSRAYYKRITSGGRLEYTHGWVYGTISSYYQFGQTSAEKKINAYYIQPEISANSGKTFIRLGAEILSGDKPAASKEISQSFVPLYGVAWKFMGNMNLFTRFPADVNQKGLVNPYLFIGVLINGKLALRGDAHLFYSQYPLLRESKEIDGKFLGFESDFSLNYKPAKSIEIIYGFSFTMPTKRMELYGKIKDSEKIPIWSYLMVSYAPRLLSKRIKTRVR